jgi:EAL domain-containing protein (putative c-di-GMP-specific phosphodiesterase class I)
MLNQSQAQQSLPPLDEIINSAVDLARICLRMDVAFISEFRNDRRIFRYIAANEGAVPVRVGHSDPLSESYCQHIIDGTIPAVVGDSHVYPALQRLSCTEAMQIRAHLGVPILLSDGSVFGTFCCYSTNPRSTLRQVDVEALTCFAQLIALMLENRVLTERAIQFKSARITEIIEEQAVSIAYQPIVDMASNKIIGFEALARFECLPERAPDEWFQEAHQVSKGTELELLVIDLAVSAIDRIASDTYLALNVSPETVLSGALDQHLSGIPAERVVLEITEHVPVEEYEDIKSALAFLRGRGLKLAIDDAGSGYASFRHILQLQPDIIKLDQSLIRNIDLDPGRRALASALTSFAKDTKSRVVAEGVETQQELETLRDLQVQAAQGYLLGRPIIVL